MKTWILYPALGIVLITLIWLFFGRGLVTQVLDRIALSPPEVVKVGQIEVTPQFLRIDIVDTARGNLLYGKIRIEVDPSHHAFLHYSGKTFALGLAAQQFIGSGLLDYYITPDPGDEVVHTVRHSLASWKAFDFMSSASEKRNSYHEIDWRKPDGSRLRAIARYEEWYYGGLDRRWTGAMIGPESGMTRFELWP